MENRVLDCVNWECRQLETCALRHIITGSSTRIASGAHRSPRCNRRDPRECAGRGRLAKWASRACLSLAGATKRPTLFEFEVCNGHLQCRVGGGNRNVRQ